MKDRILLKTNVVICLVIAVGFLLTAVLSYRANYSASLKSIEQISDLTSEGIYFQMSNILSKPVNVSLTMANDSLLKDFLSGEPEHVNDREYTETIAEYLRAYQVKYDYDSVFLVSAATSRYYNFGGLDRVLKREDPENFWYYDVLLPSEAEYGMNVDNDEVEGAENAVTLFVNCKIKDEQGELMGVVGVGVRIDHLQGILREYQEDFGVNAYFVDDDGTIELSSEHTGYERVSLFKEAEASETQRNILNWKTDGTPFSFWDLNETGQKQNYVVARYLPDIGWHLITERDTQALVAELNRQLALTVLIILVIVGTILFTITKVIRNFDRKIVTLTRTYEQQRKTMFERATEQIFDDIYELDITHNRPANQVTEAYFERLGAPAGTPFDKALGIVAEKQIKPEFREGYLNTFSPQHVLEAFQAGEESLHYDFMIAEDGGKDYYWMRIIARLQLSESDGTLYMLTYRQNIDEEKRREQRMQELASTDEMTGLLNKTITRKAITTELEAAPTREYAFLILDIDHFKEANDLFGHAFGDAVIRHFSEVLRNEFGKEDIIGRIGGDEFAVFLSVPDIDWTIGKAMELNEKLNRDYVEGEARWHMSASIGVAFAPQDGRDFDTLYQRADAALYETKKRGRGSFTLYRELEE